MFLIIFAALIAAGETAKLDRTYLPPISAATAGGGPGSLQLPFSRSNEGSPDNQDVPTGGFVNNHQGVVVEAALAGTRASGSQSGLGGPRITYGSSDSKVGDAAFRETNNRFPQGPASGLLPNGEPDLSAFYKPPSFKPGNIQIIRDYVSNTVKYQNNIGLDKFNYAFETENGIKMSENGISRNGIQAQGGYSYTGDDGKVYSVVYTADKNGYRPTGNHLPTPPPIPAEILESLKQNARDEAAGLVDDGSYDAKKYNTEDNYAENETNDRYNDRQSNKFGDRPVFVSGFINQNQQAIVAPNFNGQFGVNDASKDTAFSKPDSSKFDSLMQSDNRFGSIREPSKDNTNNLLSNKQIVNQFPSTGISAAYPNIEAKPLSQQKLQEQKPFEKPSFNRPSSYDTSNLGILSSSVGSSQSNTGSLFGQSANNFGSGNNKLSGQGFQYQPTQGSFNLNALSQGLPIEESSNPNKPFSAQNSLSTFTSSQPSTGYFTSQPIQQFPSSNIQSSQNGRLPGSQFSSSPLSPSSNSISENSNQSVFTTPLKPSFPTKQPLTTLTTPLESFDVTNEDESFSQTDINKKEDIDNKRTPTYTSQEFTASLSQSTPSIEEVSSTSYTETDRPSFIALDNRFSSTQTTQSAESTQFIQPQAPDHSYIYNRPNKPFNTPFVGSGFISSSSANSQMTSLLPQSSFFTNAPQTSISSMKNGGVIGPQTANLNRVTQASLSTFPSRVPGVSTQINTKPFLNAPSASTFSQIIPTPMTETAQIFSIPSSETISTQGIQEIEYQDGNTSLPSQQNTQEVYQYPKPTTVLPSQAQKQNLESDQKNNNSSFSQFNVVSNRKPQTEQNSFNLKPHSQFFQDAFNNKGLNVPLFPKPDEQNAPQFNSGKTQNQATGQKPQFEQQNFATLPKKPEQSFGSQSRPQLQEIGLFGNKEQLNLSSASHFGSKPFTSASSLSQGFNTPTILSQTEQDTFFKPTEEPTTQNIQSVINNKEITTPQQDESPQTSFAAFNKPFGFINQKPLNRLEQQHSFSSRHPAIDPTSQLPSLTSKFGNKPISVGTQFGTFNTQNKLSDINGQSSFTSTSPINSQESTQFNQNTLSNEQTTMFVQGDSFDNKHSTLLPTSTQFQTGSFDTQRPTTQFGPFSFSTSLKPSSQSQFGSQQDISSFGQGSFNSKESTPSQFDQSTQQFGTDLKNKLSTQMPSATQVQYNDYNEGTTNTQFSVPSSFDQFVSTNQPSQLSTVFTGQLGQDNDSKTTTGIQFYNKQQTMTSNEPSTLISSTFEIQTPTQSSEFGLNDYRKPVQGLLTPSQKPDSPQFQANIQLGQQGLLNIQKGKPGQFTQPLFNTPSSKFSTTNEDKVESVTQQNNLGTFPSTQDGAFSTSQNSDQSSGEIYEYNKPSTQFGQQGILNVQKEKPAQFTKPLFNSQFTTNEGRTETVTQENILNSFPSTPEVLSSTLQNAGQSNGEIYEYNKPNKQFGQQHSISVQKENPAQFSQTSFNFASSQFSTIDDKSESVTQENISTGLPSTQAFSSTSDNSDQSTEEIYEYNNPEQSLSTSSEIDGTSQFGQKIQSTFIVNRQNFVTNQQTDNVQNKNADENTSTTSEGINEQPRPQLAFHSACCGGLFKKPLGSNNLNPSFNIFNQNKDSISNQKPSQVNQSIDKQNIEPEKASSFTGVGEQFPSSRKPPSFDEKGYHY